MLGVFFMLVMCVGDTTSFLEGLKKYIHFLR